MSIENRKLSKSSVFSTEVIVSAPANLEVTRQSNKYRDLRRELLTALENQAWGLKMSVTSETKEELKRQITNLINAVANWSRAVKLEKLYGKKAECHVRTTPRMNFTEITVIFVKVIEEEKA